MNALQGDSQDYDVLERAARRTAVLDGLSCEIGLRQGKGSAIIMEFSTPGSTHVAIDPYGGLPYQYGQGLSVNGLYPNWMRDETLPALYALAGRLRVNLLFFNMKDGHFYGHFHGGVLVCDQGECRRVNAYRLVHVDGEHHKQAVMNAVRFFVFDHRVVVGGEIVFDDVNLYDHDSVEPGVLSSGFRRVERQGNRAVYRRES